jgi:hypothetical protein
MMEKVETGGNNAGVYLGQNTFQAVDAQLTDPTYSAIRITYAGTDQAQVRIENNFCNWYRLSNATFAQLDGNFIKSFANERSGRSANYAKKSYMVLSNSSPVSEVSEITMVSATSQFNCVKCNLRMAGGYRYSCDKCQISLCACCFHNVDSIPHPHPLRPHLIANSSQY